MPVIQTTVKRLYVQVFCLSKDQFTIISHDANLTRHMEYF